MKVVNEYENILYIVKDENGNVIETKKSWYYDIVPDEGKAFKDPDTGKLIIRESDGKGAMVGMDSNLIGYYEEVDIE